MRFNAGLRVLALEVSTSSAKAAVYDRGVIQHLSSMPWPAQASDLYTQDADAIYAIAMQCARDALQGQPVDAVALCSIWHSHLLLDHAMRPLGRIRTWADTSSAQTAAAVARDDALAQRLYEQTGCTTSTMYPLYQLMHRRDQHDRALQQACYVASQHSYLVYRLTGQFAASRCTESGSGLVDLRTLDWHPDLLAMAGITRDHCPALYEPTHTFGLCEQAAQALGLPAGTPVALGGGDGALNQIGSDALAAGRMTLSIGTSGALRLACEAPFFTPQRATWCYYITDGRYISGAATSGAGNCINWLRDTLFDGRYTLPQLEALAAACGDPPLYLPFSFGERSPGFKGERRGVLCAMDGTHGPGALYAAVVRGVLFNLYQCYEILQAGLGRPSDIFFSGGVTQSPLWVSTAATLFGRALACTPGEHASLVGAAALGYAALGEPMHVLGQPPHMAHPDPALRPALLRQYERYLACYQAMGE